MSALSKTLLVHQLARLYGIQTAYHDVAHRRRPASLESLLAVLPLLRAPVETLHDIPSALRERQQMLWRRVLEPVVIAWGSGPLQMEVRLPSSLADTSLAGYLRLETGEQLSLEWRKNGLPILKTVEVEGGRYVIKRLSLPSRLPLGYHRFILELRGELAEALVISAPLKAYIPPNQKMGRGWGVFIPLYALYHQEGWGSGNFSDLETLITWVARMGGDVVATLPLLASFLDAPLEPCPYAPVSRLMWNEFYLDISKVPELQKCAQAQTILSSSPFQEELETVRNLHLVDYRREMVLKRQVLEELSRFCFSEASDYLESLQHFAEVNPIVEDYARFRAVCEWQCTSWRSWPHPLCEGILREGDYDETRKRYHIYVQWLAHQQIQAVSERARENGLRLHLDLPLGVHPDGYDVWRNQDLFVQDASVGAPPDVVFTWGQDWRFPPLHPERLRQQGYRYYIACLRHHLRHAGILRIDHVMGLHRLFWIPQGMEASQGVYIRYPAEEFYAILALESHRNKAVIVGEDLGTVSPEVRPAMLRHGLQRMYVVQYELDSNLKRALRTVPANAVASLNTHDMPPFAAFWQELDIQSRQEMGLLNEAAAQQEIESRQTLKEYLVSLLQSKGQGMTPCVGLQAILRATLAFLSASRALVVLVNLEDLWQEVQYQNMPGFPKESCNWRRKARYTFDTFCQLPQVVEALNEIDGIRRGGGDLQ